MTDLLNNLTVEQKLAVIIVAAHYLLHPVPQNSPDAVMAAIFAGDNFDRFVHDPEVEAWMNAHKPECVDEPPPPVAPELRWREN